MTRMKIIAIYVTVAAMMAFGQGKPSFEVATIKLSAPIDPAKLMEDSNRVASSRWVLTLASAAPSISTLT